MLCTASSQFEFSLILFFLKSNTSSFWSVTIMHLASLTTQSLALSDLPNSTFLVLSSRMTTPSQSVSSLTSHQHRLGWFSYGEGVVHPFLDPLLHWFTSLLFLEPISNPIWWRKGFQLTFSFFLPQTFAEHHLCSRHSTWEYPRLTRNLFLKCSQGPRQVHRNLESNLNQTHEGFLKEAISKWRQKSHLEWMNNKVLIYSTGNYIQYPVINHNGKEYEKYMNHFAVHEKLTQHCKSTLLE